MGVVRFSSGRGAGKSDLLQATGMLMSKQYIRDYSFLENIAKETDYRVSSHYGQRGLKIDTFHSQAEHNK